MKRVQALSGSIFPAHPQGSVLVTSLHASARVMTMDLSEYLLIEDAARDRLDDLCSAAGPQRWNEAASPSSLAKLLYVASALRAKPREIDSYIDYFGDRALSQR